MSQHDERAVTFSPVDMQKGLLSLPTYAFLPPDPNPMFLEKRVYQGSTGKVYPLPFTDRVSDTKGDMEWEAVRLENEYIQIVVLPQFGGRIYSGRDRTNGYDFVYRNKVLKPALVGLAGPWLSGGIEFNWPQHHRPTTFSPVQVAFEESEDGSASVWLGEHEPFNRMKGMHGVTLHPGKSYVEVKVRLYNRTPLPQTFLWWANLAVHVNDNYQAIFPPDVQYVVDHAKRAVSRYPIATGSYYGVDYSAGVDISWFKNIPVPSSYMAPGSRHDFVGGYDHGKEAGVIHIADHHISPGKKLWTWGAGNFGRVWYDNLTDEDGPYVEIMSGVYTDNQPDFSWLHPYETRTFSQYWYPIRDIGYVRAATLDAAVNLERRADGAWIGVNTTAPFHGALVQLWDASGALWETRVDIAPDRPFTHTVSLPWVGSGAPLTLTVTAGGKELVRYTDAPHPTAAMPAPATPVPPPQEVATNEELYLDGLHLEQYRHATRLPEPYFEEALRRDGGDARNNNALGLQLLRRGLFAEAADRFRHAIDRLTVRNPNPYDGEPYYNLGVALRFLEDHAAAYDAFAKSTWNYAWRAPAHLALAQLDTRAGRTETALGHVRAALQENSQNMNARNLEAALLRRLGRLVEARAVAEEAAQMDLLDLQSRNELYLANMRLGSDDEAEQWGLAVDDLLGGDGQSAIDLAGDYAGAGLWDEAREVLRRYLALGSERVDPLVLYYLGYYAYRRGGPESGMEYYRQAAAANPDYCFPNRLDSIAVLRHAIEHNAQDARAPYYLGNLLYDKKRYDEAITLWEQSRALDGTISIVHRNLGLAYFNIQGDAAKAKEAYRRAMDVNREDARLVYELDQLEKRIGIAPEERLKQLQAHGDLVERRDDLYLEIVTLQVQMDRADEAIRLLRRRHFHPWEGGEGKVTGAYVLAHLIRGNEHLRAGRPRDALQDFLDALTYPVNLGEGVHEILTPQASPLYHVGRGYEALGEEERAQEYFRRVVADPGRDTETRYYRALALRRTGREEEARRYLDELVRQGEEQLSRPTEIDYFATSLPTFLIFEDDLAKRNAAEAHYMRGLGFMGLGEERQAVKELTTVLELDRNHMGAQIHLAAVRVTEERRSTP